MSANAFSTAAFVAPRSDRKVMFDSGTASFFLAVSMNVVAHCWKFLACSSSPETPVMTRRWVCWAKAGVETQKSHENTKKAGHENSKTRNLNEDAKTRRGLTLTL